MAQDYTDIIRKHRRQSRRQILFPLSLLAGLLIGLTVVLFVLSRSGGVSAQQIAIVATCLMVPLIFLPIILVLLVVDYVSLVVAFGSGKVHHLLINPLEIVRGYSQKLLDTTQKTSERIANPLIETRAFAAEWRYRLNALFSPESEDADER